MQPSDPNQVGYFVCECPEQMRSACNREGFYKEYDGKRYCVMHYPGKEKSEEFQRAISEKIAQGDLNFVGVWFPDEIKFKGALSNVAYFNEAEFVEGVKFSHSQFADAAFFINTKFRKHVQFYWTKFELAVFEGASFEEGALFDNAEFGGEAHFESAKFTNAVSFRSANFKSISIFDKSEFAFTVEMASIIDFKGAVFHQAAHFHGTLFTKTDEAADGRPSKLYYEAQRIEDAWSNLRWISFAGARFKDTVVFAGTKFPHLGLTFAEAIFEKPDLVMFTSVTLYPHSFFRVDPRRFKFFDVDWPILLRKGELNPYRLAFERNALVITTGYHIKEQPFGSWLPYLGITFRQLAVNAEDNNRYEEAAGFRYLAMHVTHKGKDTAMPFPISGRLTNARSLTWWYWLLSGYGERVGRAFGWLVAIWLLFAIIYWSGNATWWQTKPSTKSTIENKVGEQASVAPLSLPEALIYSVSVSMLQKPEPLPSNKRAKVVVLLETLVGPLQAAFLILAIRRKFMR